MKIFLKILLHTIVAIIIPVSFIISLVVNTVLIPVKAYKAVEDKFRNMLIRMPLQARGLMPYYDCNGLRFHIEHLKGINLLQMITWSMYEQAEYADIMAVQFCKDGYTSLNGPDFKPFTKDEINVTSIGNAAYICIHHPDENEQTKAFNQLNEIEKLLRS